MKSSAIGGVPKKVGKVNQNTSIFNSRGGEPQGQKNKG